MAMRAALVVTLMCGTVQDADTTLVDRVFKLGLFDPTGARRVQAKVEVRYCWGRVQYDLASGWMKDGRLILDDLFDVPAPADFAPIEFVEEARKAIAAADTSGSLPNRGSGGAYEVAPGNEILRYLYWAAWLHRQGHKKESATLLGRVRDSFEGDDKKVLAAAALELADQELDQAMSAYLVAADQEAQDHAERLAKMEQADKFPDGRILLLELKRRKAEGMFGVAPEDPTGKPIDALIRDLDQVSSREREDGGGIFMSDDARVRALIALGDTAVPALLECLDNETRYTRSVDDDRRLLPVQAPAVAALLGILSMTELAPARVPRRAEDHLDRKYRESAAKIRFFWDRFGALPFHNRMMKMIVDKEVPNESIRQAARNLGFAVREFDRDRPVWSPTKREAGGPPNPVIAKFKEPTAAEAILKALDRDPDGERHYLEALAELRDGRILPEILKRARGAVGAEDRARYAEVAHCMGDSSPLEVLAEEFAAGRLKAYGAGFSRIVAILAGAANPKCDAALNALLESSHPNHRDALGTLSESGRQYEDNSLWWRHPFCLKLFRLQLENVTSEDLDRCQDGLWNHVWGAPIGDPSTRKWVTAAGEFLDRFRGRLRQLTEKEVLVLRTRESIYLPDIAPLARAATADDVVKGLAVFHLEGRGKPVRIDRPIARLKKSKAPVLVVQAETGPDGKIRYGVIGRVEMGVRNPDELEDWPAPR